MITTTMRLTIATAALAVAACSASAQTLKAEIPMSFRAGDTVMAPGTYLIRQEDGTGLTYVRLYNLDTRASIVLGQVVKDDVPRAWRQDGAARMSFECVAGSCSLRRMWNAAPNTFALRFPAPKAHPANIASQTTTVVTLAMVKAR